MTAQQIHRPTEAICPPWCEGHSDSYQPWEEYIADGRWHREHACRAIYVGSGWAAINQVEGPFPDHSLGAPAIVLYTANDQCDLTPKQARELAAVLVGLAERAEERG